MNTYECKVRNENTGETRIILITAKGYADAAEKACTTSGYANPTACWVRDMGDMREAAA